MLNVDNLKVFYGDAQALWDVSFHVPAEKIVSLVGSNGAGKTTTLKTISNLIKPRSGEIRIAATSPQVCPAIALPRKVWHTCGRAAAFP